MMKYTPRLFCCNGLTRFLSLNPEMRFRTMAYLNSLRQEQVFMLLCSPGKNYPDLEKLLRPLSLEYALLHKGSATFTETVLPEVRQVLLNNVANPEAVKTKFDSVLENSYLLGFEAH